MSSSSDRRRVVACSFSPPGPADDLAFAASCVRDLLHVLTEKRREVRRLVANHGETDVAIFFGATRTVCLEVDRRVPFALRVARGLVRERLHRWLRARGWTSLTDRTPLEQLVGLAALELGDVGAPVISLADARARRSA